MDGRRLERKLGDPVRVTAATDNRSELVFTRKLAGQLEMGLRRLELVMADDPSQVLASRTFGVVTGQAQALQQ